MAQSSRGLTSLTIAGVRLTRRGWAFVLASTIAFIGAYVGGRQELLYVACLLVLLPVVAVAIVAVRRPRLTVTRTFSPRVIQAGTSTSVSLTVRNLSPARSMRAVWWDVLPWFPEESERTVLPALLPRSARFTGRGNSVTVGYDLRPPRRGVFAIGPMRVELLDAFGLALSEATVGTAEHLVVTPEVIPLAESGLSIPAGDGESRLVQRRATGDDDDTITREYRSGDAMRRVHWRATARHGDLMVRQEEQRSFPEARVIVDTRAGGFRDVSDDHDDETESAAFEWVVRMLASVAVHLRRSGFLVTIEETGTPQLDALSRGRRRTWGDEEFLSTLASLHLADGAFVPHAAGERSGRGPVVAIVGSPDAETVEWIANQRRAGELAVVFMARGVSSVESIHRSFGIPLAASEVGERLADAGWLVVPVRPTDDHAAAWQAVVHETGRARAGN